MDLFQKCFDDTRAKLAMQNNVYPYFHALNSCQASEVVMEGKRTLMFGSNNYLGLASDDRVKEAAIKAVEKFGASGAGSRLLCGNMEIHIELEDALAGFLQKDAALVFSSGYQTNLAIISSLVSRNDIILSDSLNHASIIDGSQLAVGRTYKYKHNDMADLERLLAKFASEINTGILIVTDGVFSMEGEICDLPSLVRLKRKYGARLLIDDAHSLGVLGDRGRGTAEYYGLSNEVDMIMNSLSKALASQGGCIAGSERVIQYIKHNARPFIFSSAISPAQIGAARESLRILEQEPQRVRRLNEIAAYMKHGLQTLPNTSVFDSGNYLVPIIPLLTGSINQTLNMARHLFNRGVYVNPVMPPAVPIESCRVRSCYCATHTKAQLDEGLAIIDEVTTAIANFKSGIF